MVLVLTAEEYTVLLGLLEDIAQEEDVQEAFSIQSRMSIKSIIRKLNGTYFGQL